MSTPHAHITIMPAPQNTPQIWGMSPQERIEKQISKSKLAPQGSLILRADVVYDAAVLNGLATQTGILLADEDGQRLGAHVAPELAAAAQSWINGKAEAPARLQTLTPQQAGAAYNLMLRKRAAPKCYVVTQENARDIEWKLYLASYKGVTDLVTKYVWPVPAYHATRLCARLHFSPNLVTSIGAILTLLTLWLFWEGHFGWGLLSGWVMTFLDTVDGKLARVTLTSSKWGNIFDHGIDLLHPPFWYMAWAYGLIAAGYTVPFGLEASLWAIFLGYIGGRLIEGYYMRRFGFHIHVWRRFDSFFRLIVARRNPNMIVLTLSWILGVPDIGFLIIVLWTLAAIPVHIIQSLQSELTKARGKAVTSWLSA